MKTKKLPLVSAILAVALAFMLSAACGAQSSSAVEQTEAFAHGALADIDYTESNDVFVPADEFANIKEIREGQRPYFTRAEMEQAVKENGLSQHHIDVRQKHIQAELPYGEENKAGTPCDNTFYFLIDGWRVCSTCAYVFTQEEDEALGVVLCNSTSYALIERGWHLCTTCPAYSIALSLGLGLVPAAAK